MHKSFNICPNACNYIIYTSYLNIYMENKYERAYN